MNEISSGIVVVSSGVTSTGLLFVKEGVLQVMDEGRAEDIGVADGGNAFVSNGGVLLSCTASSGGTATVLDGGFAQAVSVEKGGLYLVSSGGTAHQSLIQSGGTQIVYADVTAAATTVQNGGVMEASSGAYVRVPVISQGGILHVWNGALVDGARVSGLVEVNSKATLNSASALDGGRISVLKGGYAYEAKISSGGSLDLFSGGRANYTLVCEDGTVMVSAGASCFNAELNGGRIELAGAIAPADPGTEAVPGGFASNITINSGGSLIVSSGATATKIRENGGYVGVEDGADVLFATNSFSELVLSNASATIHSGTTATDTTINSGAFFFVSSGGIANSTVANSGGGLIVSSGGTADVITVDFGGGLAVFSGGTALQIKENGGLVHVDDGTATFVSNAFSGVVLDFDNWATVHSGTTANSVTVDSGGRLEIYSGGTATELLENGGYVEISEGATATFASNTISGLELVGSATVHSGTTATDTTVSTGGKLEVFSGGMANGVTVIDSGLVEVSSGGVIDGAVVNSGGSLLIFRGAKFTGHMTFESGAEVIPFVGSILDFDLTQTEAGDVALVNDLSILLGTPTYTLTVSAEQAKGVYMLADGSSKFKGALTVQDTLGESLGILSVGETLSIGETDYTLNLDGAVLTLTVAEQKTIPANLIGTKDRVSWDPIGEDGYVVEYSTDGFAHCLDVKVSSNAADMLALPAGTYQWRVRAADGEAWAVGNEIVSNNDNTPKVLQSNADDYDDLFFAKASGIWGSIFYAQHVGSVNDWNGTNEFISANGKGRIQNLFFGSSDPNVLCLTDSENGDAIFVDDVYTDLPEGIEEHTARLYKIQEIRAGFGDDIVDMTSQRFEYVGDGLTIRGGAGNDTIWANKGDNWLFGDAGNDRIVGASGNDVIAGGIGNDRMHGGGGDDVFTFCDNWGVDNVEQLADGKVTLWFASGDESKWNAETMTYTDGENSVKVTGVTSVNLMFGDDGSEQYAMLSGMGAFFDATSERIFEESGKGVLASL